MSLEAPNDSLLLTRQRSHEESFSKVGASRCGEIFVTCNADKWTFFCSYCEKATSDIGVFICHIRLDHLNTLQHLPELTGTIPIASEPQSTTTTIPSDSKVKVEGNFILETLDSEKSCYRVSEIAESSLADSGENENIIANENPISTSYPSQEIKKETFAIASENEDYFYPVHENAEILRKNDKYDGSEDLNDRDTSSSYFPNDDESNDNLRNFKKTDDKKASCSKRSQNVRMDLEHQCEYCDMHFKFRSYLDNHLKKIHKLKLNEIPLKCKYCKKIFRSTTGLKYHLKAHDEKTHLKCPICQVKHKQNYYVSHVLSHESDTCFPCQVCGKIYSCNEERMKHWKVHANELPFGCDFCYRRFRKHQYLLHHLRSHRGMY